MAFVWGVQWNKAAAGRRGGRKGTHGQRLAVEALADPDHLVDPRLALLPRLLRRPEVDGFVHPLEDELGVALRAREV